MVEMTRLGVTGLIEFRVRWSDLAAESAEAATRGEVVLSVGGSPVWGSERAPFQWTWVELLEWLGESWKFLVWEESYPRGLDPPEPMLLEDECERLRVGVPWAAARVQEEVLSFLEHHDVATCLHGATAPPVRILRTGNLCSVATRTGTIIAAFTEVLESLSSIGDAISARLASCRDPRSTQAVSDWQEREHVSEEFVLTFGARLPPTHWKSLRRRVPRPVQEWNTDECFAAARFAGEALTADVFEQLLDNIIATPRTLSPELEEATVRAQALLETSDRAYVEGYQLARALRGPLGGVDADASVDIEKIFSELAVPISHLDLRTGELDAVAIFGSRHGPAVFLNSSGPHARGMRGRRATLAHELCHLLIDRGNALPVAEALGGSAPRWPERRANAFAAELLLPQSEALSATHAANPESQDDWSRLVEMLSKKFEASRAVVAWQILNGHEQLAEPIPPPARRFLERAATKY